MTNHAPTKRKSFTDLEQLLTKGILANLVLFLLVMAASVNGIGWLKLILGILTILASLTGILFLVMVKEHRRSRSYWMLASFLATGLCTLVSLISGAPFPGK